MSHTEDKKSGCTEGETHSERDVKDSLSEKKAGIILQIQNGDFLFGIHGQEWISGPGNIPEIFGKCRTELTVGRWEKAEEERKTITEILTYDGKGKKSEIRRTLEYCPDSGSFTIQDEPVILQKEDHVTEVLRFTNPVRLADGRAVVEMEGQKISVFVRNQENIRVEICYSPGKENQEEIYCLKWDLKKGCAYTCCQIEIQTN